MTDPVLTIDEVAELAGVAPSTVRRWLTAAEDPLPHRRFGRLQILVWPDDLLGWATRHNMILLREPDDVARPWPRPEGTA